MVLKARPELRLAIFWLYLRSLVDAFVLLFNRTLDNARLLPSGRPSVTGLANSAQHQHWYFQNRPFWHYPSHPSSLLEIHTTATDKRRYWLVSALREGITTLPLIFGLMILDGFLGGIPVLLNSVKFSTVGFLTAAWRG
jgi:hypothetical protein